MQVHWTKGQWTKGQCHDLTQPRILQPMKSVMEQHSVKKCNDLKKGRAWDSGAGSIRTRGMQCQKC